MKGIDSCEKCIHNPICTCKRDIESLSFKTNFTISGRVYTKGSKKLEEDMFKLLADNCKYYNDKNIEIGEEVEC